MREHFRFARSGTGKAGLLLLALVVGIAVIGPMFAPHSLDEPIGLPFSGPGSGAPLGTDELGRDVLSRVLWGGRSVFVLAGIATAIAYAGGLLVGLLAGYTRYLVDPILMRSADVLLSFPALLFLLVLVTGAGTSNATLVLGVAVIQMPQIARIIRSATLAQSTRGFVEAAVARGESTASILRREILPNIVGPIAADAGCASRLDLPRRVAELPRPRPAAAVRRLGADDHREPARPSLQPWAVLAPAVLIALPHDRASTSSPTRFARSLGRSLDGAGDASMSARLAARTRPRRRRVEACGSSSRAASRSSRTSRSA